MTSKLAHLIAKQQPLALQHALSPAKRLLLFNNTTGRLAFSLSLPLSNTALCLDPISPHLAYIVLEPFRASETQQVG